LTYDVSTTEVPMPEQRTTIDDVLAAARARFRPLTPSEVGTAQAEGTIVVDTRCEADRERVGAIPGSIPIQRTVLEWRADPDSPWKDPRIADLEARLILVCNDGFSSSLAAASLLDLGFENVTDLEGGANAWAAAGLPLD
jgi:rhodanese-related sulfurtransferase